MRRVLMAGLSALLLSACGRLLPATPPSPPPPGQRFDVVATEQDRQVGLRVGQTLELALKARPGFKSWEGLQVKPAGVLVSIPDTAATAVRGMTLAAFRAAAPGTAEIDAYAAPDCPPGAACPAIVAVLNLKVTVSS